MIQMTKKLAVAKQKITVTGKTPKVGSFTVSTLLNNNSLTYTWSKSKNAAFYEYSIYDKTDKKYVLKPRHLVKIKTKKFDNLKENHKYTLYVSAYNGNPYRSQYIDKSNATSTRFRTVKKDFSVLAIKSPQKDSKLDTASNIKVEWTKYSDSAKYYIYSRDTKTNKFTCNYYTEKTNFTLPKYCLTNSEKQNLCVMVKDNDKIVAYKSINLNITGTISKPKDFKIEAKASDKKIVFSANCENATNYYYSLKDLTNNEYITKPTVKEKISNITRSNLNEKHKYEIMVVACNGNCYKNKNISYSNLDSTRITKKTLTISGFTNDNESVTNNSQEGKDKTVTSSNSSSNTKNGASSTNKSSITDKKITPTVSVELNSLKRSSNTYTMSFGDATLKWKSEKDAKYYLTLYNVTDKKTLIDGGILSKFLTNDTYSFNISKSYFAYGKKYLVTMALEDKDHKRANNTAITDKFYIQVKACVVKIGGAHGDFDGKSGDSKDNETSIDNFNNSWVQVIRANNSKVAERLAYACKYLCDNKNVNVGYTQNTSGSYTRYNLYNAMVNYKCDLSKLKGKLYGADCSSFVSACLYYALKEIGLQDYITTSYDTDGLEAILVNGSGKVRQQFNVVQNLVKETKKSNIDYTSLKAGDILLRSKKNKKIVGKSGGHTEIVVSVSK